MIPSENYSDYEARIMDALQVLQTVESREAFKIFDEIVSIE